MIQTYGGSFTNDWTAYQGFRDAFSEVMDPRFYNIEWLDRKVWNCEFRFWSNGSAAIVAKIKIYPAGGKAVHGMIAAGDLQGIKALIPLAEEWGRDNGCVTAEIASREGWARVLDGYEPSQILIVKELG